jgi:hypothetical protein
MRASKTRVSKTRVSKTKVIKARANKKRISKKRTSNVKLMPHKKQIREQRKKYKNILEWRFNMKKSSFVAMILGTVGGIMLSLGMCMCLLPEWNAFKPGVIMGSIGLLVLLIMVIVWRKLENKAPIRLEKKTVASVLIGVTGAILLGVGMCLTMVWSNMILGIAIGLIGIVILLCLIPFVKGLK